MPWQQYVADVILEIDPETGRLAYDEFGLTVPRQSGKSTFVLAKFVHRCSATKFFGGRQQIVYTAQTRQKAREKWEEDYVASLDDARAFRNRYTTNSGSGREHIRFKNGSRFGIEANTEKAGHGGTLDEAYIDEAFSQVDARLEQAFGPAMITRHNAQLGWISTAGWSDGSPYLRDKVKLGRAAVEAGTDRGVAYFEWSAPEGSDPADEDVWWRCMPALGHTISIDKIRARYKAAQMAGKMDEFRRPYLNLWVPKPTEEDEIEPGVIDLAQWGRLADSNFLNEPTTTYAVECDLAQAWFSVAQAQERRQGGWHVRLVRRDRGDDWVVQHCQRLNTESPGVFVVDGHGPAASMAPKLREAGLSVVVADTADVADSFALTTGAIEDETLHYVPEATLTSAVAVAKKRPCGERGFAFGRRLSGADIAPIVTVGLALWGAHQPVVTSAYESGSLMTL